MCCILKSGTVATAQHDPYQYLYGDTAPLRPRCHDCNLSVQTVLAKFTCKTLKTSPVTSKHTRSSRWFHHSAFDSVGANPLINCHWSMAGKHTLSSSLESVDPRPTKKRKISHSAQRARGPAKRKNAKPLPQFLRHLWSMLNDPEIEDIISWHDGQQNTFTVHSQDRFSCEILPRYFKHCKFSSFVRQLNMYQC